MAYSSSTASDTDPSFASCGVDCDARVDHARHSVEQALDGVRPDDHLAELVADRAEGRDRLSELFPRRRVPRGLADRRARAAAAHAAELEAAEIEDVERDLVALADLAEHVFRRHLHVLEDHGGRRRTMQAHLVLFLAARDAAERPLDDERGELLAVDLGKDDEDVGEAAVGDPHLLAVQHEAAVRLPRRRASWRPSASDPEPVSLRQ